MCADNLVLSVRSRAPAVGVGGGGGVRKKMEKEEEEDGVKAELKEEDVVVAAAAVEAAAAAAAAATTAAVVIAAAAAAAAVVVLVVVEILKPYNELYNLLVIRSLQRTAMCVYFRARMHHKVVGTSEVKPTFEVCTSVVLDSIKLLTTAHVLTVNRRSKF